MGRLEFAVDALRDRSSPAKVKAAIFDAKDLSGRDDQGRHRAQHRLPDGPVTEREATAPPRRAWSAACRRWCGVPDRHPGELAAIQAVDPAPAASRLAAASAPGTWLSAAQRRDQAGGVQRPAAGGLHVGVELVDQRGHRQARAVARASSSTRPRSLRIQSRRSRSRTCRRPSSARGCPSASSARRPCR